MHIQAGIRRGKKLKSVKGLKVRPLMGRVKKSLFDTIGRRITNAVFLDLFAGSGSVGIEALSRGAAFVQFVEKDTECVDVINYNLNICGFSKSAGVFRGDVFQFKPHSNRYDFIFIGPPYRENLTEKILLLLGEKTPLKKDGWIICQHHYRESVEEVVSRFKLFRQKKYGMTVLSFFQWIE